MRKGAYEVENLLCDTQAKKCTRRQWLGLSVGSVVATLVGCGSSEVKRNYLSVAAASDLSKVFLALVKQYESETGVRVNSTFGSSGLLSKQIAEGAPFDVFLSAHRLYVDELVNKNKTHGAPVPYANGRLVLWSNPSVKKANSIDELKASNYRKIALANPEHAPYGKAAKEALENRGVWGAVKDKIVLAENVNQALIFATSGNADVAIVAMSLVHNTPEQFVEVNPEWFSTIEQAAVITKQCQNKTHADAFVHFLVSPFARDLFVQHGFYSPKAVQ